MTCATLCFFLVHIVVLTGHLASYGPTSVSCSLQKSTGLFAIRFTTSSKTNLTSKTIQKFTQFIF